MATTNEPQWDIETVATTTVTASFQGPQSPECNLLFTEDGAPATFDGRLLTTVDVIDIEVAEHSEQTTIIAILDLFPCAHRKTLEVDRGAILQDGTFNLDNIGFTSRPDGVTSFTFKVPLTHGTPRIWELSLTAADRASRDDEDGPPRPEPDTFSRGRGPAPVKVKVKITRIDGQPVHGPSDSGSPDGRKYAREAT